MTTTQRRKLYLPQNAEAAAEIANAVTYWSYAMRYLCGSETPGQFGANAVVVFHRRAVEGAARVHALSVSP